MDRRGAGLLTDGGFVTAVEEDRIQHYIRRAQQVAKRELDGKKERRLTPLDGQIISMHCAGLRAQEIADALGLKRRSRVYEVVNSKLAKEMIEVYFAEMDHEFRTLYRQVIDAISAALVGEDQGIRMQAVDKWLKAHGKFKDRQGDGGGFTTAEDVVQQLLAAHRASGGSPVALEATLRVGVGRSQAPPTPHPNSFEDTKMLENEKDDTL